MRPAEEYPGLQESADTLSWPRYYSRCRTEMAFRYGRRGIAVDRYKEQYALGHTVAQAAREIANREGLR